jgi:hypothetical protein
MGSSALSSVLSVPLLDGAALDAALAALAGFAGAPPYAGAQQHGWFTDNGECGPEMLV